MTITILAVGGARGPLAPAIRKYRERAGRYWKLQVTEVATGSGSAAERVMADESERLLDAAPDRGRLWALTRRGKGITSTGLASHLEKLAVAASPGITFVIGGAHGLGREVLDRADHRLSLSPLTLPHDLARLVLLEQLYRAGTIRRNEPYHKGS